MKKCWNLLKWKFVNYSFYKFDGENAPVIRGSALGALNGDAKWEEKVMELMDAVDSLFQFLFVKMKNHS
jgi:translation elongation factor EF-Tu-like GTPase